MRVPHRVELARHTMRSAGQTVQIIRLNGRAVTMNLRNVTTPHDVPVDLLVALAGTPQYGDDALSTEGTHRQAWRLSGWELTGRTGSSRESYVYVLRFDCSSGRTFAAAEIAAGGVNGEGARFRVLHRSDYDGGCTLRQARDKAASLIARQELRTA